MKSMENRATIYDVAKLAKVSAATVSRVLKGDSSVNASTYLSLIHISEPTRH